VSQIKLYLDEDAFARRLVNALRSRGIDVLTALKASISDYCGLHAEWVSERRWHAGIVIGRQQPFEVGRQLTSFSHLVSANSAGQMCDRLEFLSAWG
jgi:hypothetical protein